MYRTPQRVLAGLEFRREEPLFRLEELVHVVQLPVAMNSA